MARPRIRLDLDTAEMIVRLDHLGDLPNPRAKARLDRVLDAAFAQTQAATHVITGSLKASGKRSSYVQDGVWHGEITYGGPAPGAINNPVDYAEYERARGGSHDFFANIHVLRDGWLRALEEALEND